MWIRIRMMCCKAAGIVRNVFQSFEKGRKFFQGKCKISKSYNFFVKKVRNGTVCTVYQAKKYRIRTHKTAGNYREKPN